MQSVLGIGAFVVALVLGSSDDQRLAWRIVAEDFAQETTVAVVREGITILLPSSTDHPPRGAIRIVNCQVLPVEIDPNGQPLNGTHTSLTLAGATPTEAMQAEIVSQGQQYTSMVKWIAWLQAKSVCLGKGESK